MSVPTEIQKRPSLGGADCEERDCSHVDCLTVDALKNLTLTVAEARYASLGVHSEERTVPPNLMRVHVVAEGDEHVGKERVRLAPVDETFVVHPQVNILGKADDIHQPHGE